VESKRELGGAVRALSLHQAFDALLTERLGVQSQKIELTERTAEDIAANCHRVPPYSRVNPKSNQNQRGAIINGAAFVCLHVATRPVDGIKIASERGRDRRYIRRHLIAKSKQLRKCL
jgi:hypothetical protein